MVAELDGLDDLLEAWRGLALGDRKAIMRRLPPDRRHLFQRMLAASPAKDREEAEQALRYRAYAPWLGRLIDACENDIEGATLPKAKVRDALTQAHLQAEESLKGRAGRISLFDILRSTILEWRKRL